MSKKKDYRLYDNINDILWMLSDGIYSISDFIDGKGFYNKMCGGCWGYIDEALLEQMVRDEIITANGRILRKGFRILGE